MNISFYCMISVLLKPSKCKEPSDRGRCSCHRARWGQDWRGCKGPVRCVLPLLERGAGLQRTSKNHLGLITLIVLLVVMRVFADAFSNANAVSFSPKQSSLTCLLPLIFVFRVRSGGLAVRCLPEAAARHHSPKGDESHRQDDRDG